MAKQQDIKITPEVIAGLKKQAEHMATCGASINEVMTAADKFRQTFLDIYTKAAIKKIKV